MIENKPGAGGNIGSDFVAKAKPDGYTILGGTIGSHAINASVYQNMPYDGQIVRAGDPARQQPAVFAVNASTPYKTLKKFSTPPARSPGNTFVSPGAGVPHLAGELLKTLTNVDMTHVSYKGSGPACRM